MPYKTSSINQELWKYMFRSSGWISILSILGLLFALPLELFISIVEERTDYYGQVKNLFAIHSTIQYALMVVVPVLVAVFLFRFLQVKQMSDFIHSLPIPRKQIYGHHLAAGLVFLLVPIIVTAFILFVFYWTIDVSGLFTLKDIGVWAAVTFSVEVLIFSAAVFIGMITGLSALQAVLTYLTLLLPVGLVILLGVNIQFLLLGFSESYYMNSVVQRLSPLVKAADLSRETLHAIDIYIYILVASSLFFVSLLLYQKRKLEYVSHAFVFPIMKPVFKYGLTTCAMLLSSWYFQGTTERIGWLLGGLIIGALTGYVVAEMVLQKTWRIQLTFKGFGYFTVAVCIGVGLIKLDPLGFETNIPDLAQVEKVYIRKELGSYSDEINSEYVALKEERSIKVLRNLHEQILEHGKSEMLAPDRHYQSISLKYELTNGKKVVREYYLQNYNAFSSYLKNIYESEEYKKKAYSLLTTSPKDVYRISISANSYLNKSIELRDSKEITQAVQAIQTDLSYQSYEEMLNPTGEYADISIVLEKNRFIHLSWKASMQHFTEWMKKTGKDNDVRILPEEIDYMLVQPYDSHVDYYNERFVPDKNALKITNGNQKEAVLNTLVSSIDGSYIVAVYYKESSEIDIKGLSNEYAPAFIKEHFNQ
ncbi:DUF6449 domain-containing protein [Peribacillus asahii]|uniref:DUF6449 domain-containing protein n=1 Tax=Peribacillus asahii TaxID=228899 RepID=UPI00207A42AA|nr:DUF6449 domain-containing protein [Peribacillus asahii]USK61001.1 DUF6449 domain-containing protein [Peribacillus asahii]